MWGRSWRHESLDLDDGGGCEWKEEGRQHNTTVWEKLREAGIVRVKGVRDEDAGCGLLVVVFFLCVYLGEGSWHC
jgi:hypothetical protein